MTTTTVVLFGATGDLARRKLLPGMLHLHESQLLAGLRVVATSLEDLTRDEFLKFVFDSIREYGRHEATEADLREFAERIHWVPGAAGTEGLRAAVDASEKILGPDCGRLHYLSVPPKAALAVVKQLAEAGLVERSRIVMEKPFGVDLETSKLLNAALHKVFDEEQIFRIDHFLGKEAAQNILAVRFANGLFEPIWHRNHIDHVQIDVPETLGLAQRADFYESTGAYRDMVVTHLFQVLAFTAMEPPTALEPSSISEEKNKVFRSMMPINPHDVVRGQYVGYRDEPGVAHDSQTETFVALKCYIDNWRWAGVPFYLRTGKRLARKVTEVAITLKPVPHLAFSQEGSLGVKPNQLILTMQPNEGVSLSLGAKIPGARMRIRPVYMEFLYGTSFLSQSPEAYERLIMDAMRGDATLFTRNDEVEAQWRICDPIVQAWEATPGPLPQYEAGSQGPAEAANLLINGNEWRAI